MALESFENESSVAKHRLTVNEKILLYLLENLKSRNQREAPLAITQKGIAEGVKIRWNHVPRAMTQLKKMGYILEDTAHIQGKTRRQKAYYLTDDGVLFAKNLRERILDWDILLKKVDGQVEKLKLSKVNLKLKTKYSPLDLYMGLSEKDTILEKELSSIEKSIPKKATFIFYSAGEISWPEELIGRETEVETLLKWIDGNEYQTMMIYGSVGIGKSALMARILQLYKDKSNIFWYQMSDSDSQEDILKQLYEFLSQLESPHRIEPLKEIEKMESDQIIRIMDKTLRGIEAIFAFNNYFKVSEDVADLFSELCNIARKNSDLKILICARDTTPFYCRFYDKTDVAERKIAELSIRGLDMEGTKKMLGIPNIDSEALKKIHLMTRGHPLTIELIKKGDVNSLKRIKGFSRHEASLLLYLKTVEAA